MNDKMYLVSETDLLELLEGYAVCAALERGGVDNWCWYGDALNSFIKESYREESSEDEDFDFSSIARIEINRYEELK